GAAGCPLKPGAPGHWPPPHAQSRQQEPPFGAAQRRLQFKRVRRYAASGAFGERDLVLVDVADRDYARQDRAVACKAFEKCVAHEPTGASRRQIEGGRGKRQRVAGKFETELAVT